MNRKQKTAGKTATKTKTITLPAQTVEKAAAQSGQTPAEEVAQMYQTLTGRKTEARHIGTKNGFATFEIAAQGAAKGNGKWRETRRKGERVLVDPDGHVYHGTAQEIREAALMPKRRDALAQDIKWARHTADKFNYTPEERREYVRENRRDAISCGHFDAHTGTNIPIPNDVYLQLCAGARLVLGDGETINDFFADMFDAALVGLLDKAAEVTGKREIPLTRYERAALDRIKREARATA